MCGRFTNRMSWRHIHDLYKLSDEIYPQSNFEPRYNIASTQNSFVVRLDKHLKRELAELGWGLLPHWAKALGDDARMINARAETVAMSPAYRAAFKSRPCLVVADGFYEWKAQVGGKQPYFIQRKGDAPFAFAGLWEPKSIADRDTFTIITCEPNTVCAEIHDRMPVMLAPEDWTAWLGTPEQRKPLMKAFPAEQIELWPVGKAVGSPRNQGPTLIEPVKA